VASANHGQLPEAGEFAAIPVPYPGDHVQPKRAPVKKTVAAAVKSSAGPAHSGKPAATPVAAASKRPAVAQAPRKSPARKPAAAAHAPGV